MFSAQQIMITRKMVSERWKEKKKTINKKGRMKECTRARKKANKEDERK